MIPKLTPFQIFENYKKANPQKCKGKSTIEICRLAGLSAKQIADLKTTSAWLFYFEENQYENQDLSITAIFGGDFNSTKIKSKNNNSSNTNILIDNSPQNYSESIDRHINAIQISMSEWYDKTNKDLWRSEIGFKNIIESLKNIGLELGIQILPYETDNIWIEDYVIRLHDNTIYAPNVNFEPDDETLLKNMDRAKKGSSSVQGGAISFGSSLRYIKDNSMKVNTGKSYVEGGNALLTNNSKGEPSAIIGEESLYYTLQALNLKPTSNNIEKAKKIIAEDLRINPKNVVYIPQIDFHIDMYYRPLHDGQIAVPDYSSAIEILTEHNFGIEEDKKNNLIDRLNYANEKLEDILKDAEKELTKNNYKIIKVPCFCIPQFDYYNSDAPKSKLKQVNYMNGICGSTTNNTTFFITNSSGYEKLDSYMKNFFKEIGINKTYFLPTQNLLQLHGGLDCITQEM